MTRRAGPEPHDPGVGGHGLVQDTPG